MLPNDRPNTIPWPPLLYIGCAGLGFFAHWIKPLPWPGQALGTILLTVGMGLAALAIAMELATALTFRKHRTTILPHRGATTLITSGPFRWSRNPIYLANTLLLIACSLIFGIAWLLLAAALAATLTHHLAIKREEVHLAGKFGSDWEMYRNTTRRWFGRI
jgi:protein-S-isoprenylcysteine O-methyltransferase Ste14